MWISNSCLPLLQTPYLLLKAAAQLQCMPVFTPRRLAPSSLSDGQLTLRMAKYFLQLADLGCYLLSFIQAEITVTVWSE